MAIQTTQEFTSKDTSINSTKLPAVYKRINYDLIISENSLGCKRLLDIGAGKYTDHIAEFMKSKGFLYYPYDPFNLPDEVNKQSLSITPDIVICSNVLNVIKEDKVMNDLHRLVASFNVPYFITVYEGNKSGIGKQTKKNCWQRNQLIGEYVISANEGVIRNTITKKQFMYLLRKGRYAS